MAEPFDPMAIIAELRQKLTGAEPPDDLVDSVGGWPAMEALAPTLVDDPLLTLSMHLLIRDVDSATAIGSDVEPFRAAATAFAGAVLATTDPGQFAAGLDIICANNALVDLIGAQVAWACAPLAVAPRERGDAPTDEEVLRHAVALEGAARLAVVGHGSKYELLALLEKVTEPQPGRYARAVARTVGLAYDHWIVDDDVAGVLDILTGVTPPTRTTAADAEVLARDEEFRLQIAGDASWTKANVDLVRALRATSSQQLIERLDDAIESLTFVVDSDDRDDAAALKSALALLRGLLVSLDAAQPQDAAEWIASLSDAEAAARRRLEFEFHAQGLNHWSGDRKRVVLEGWTRLVHDLAWLRDQLDRDSLYEAAVVLDDIMAIYSASNTYDVTRTGSGVEQVLNVMRPAIEGGFAARTGLLRNLADHTAVLRQRVDDAEVTGNAEDLPHLLARLATAETVLLAAYARLSNGTSTARESPGKPPEQAAEVPSVLVDLLGPEGSASIATLGQAALGQLAAALADRLAATDLDPDLIVTSVRQRMLAKLVSSPDFAGDVVEAVTKVLDLLIKFIANRLNTQESWHPYLFTEGADEKDLHKDLYDWLTQGQLGSTTHVEVQEIGGGRVDIMIGFAGFQVYLELKEDETQVPVANKVAYIKQTVSYQASGIRIGFLIVLRSKAAKAKSPDPHLTDLVTHALVEVTPGSPGRHVVMLELPGGRTKPSEKK